MTMAHLLMEPPQCSQPDIAKLFPGVFFPGAEGVVVLAPERTFWEKVTHDPCGL